MTVFGHGCGKMRNKLTAQNLEIKCLSFGTIIYMKI